MIVNKKQISDIFEVTETQISNYMEEGMPYKKGKSRRAGNKYSTRECIDWMVYIRGKDADYKVERARLTKLTADHKEFEVEQLKGVLVHRDEVEKEWADMLKTIKDNLIIIPSKAATLLQGVDSTSEAKRIIEQLLRETLAKIE